MRTRILMLAATVVVAANSGCSTMNNTEKGMAIGGAGGAGVGALAGSAVGRPGAGAAVGGLLGVAAGGLVGADADRQDKRDLQQAQAVANAQAQAQGQRMGMTDVIHMVQQGHDEQVIINQIRSTGSTFQLNGTDLDFLKSNNVPPRVIMEMQSARAAPVVVQQGRPVVIREQPTVIYRDPAPVYIYRRPPPPPGVFIGYRGW